MVLEILIKWMWLLGFGLSFVFVFAFHYLREFIRVEIVISN